MRDKLWFFHMLNQNSCPKVALSLLCELAFEDECITIDEG